MRIGPELTYAAKLQRFGDPGQAASGLGVPVEFRTDPC